MNEKNTSIYTITFYILVLSTLYLFNIFQCFKSVENLQSFYQVDAALENFKVLEKNVPNVCLVNLCTYILKWIDVQIYSTQRKWKTKKRENTKWTEIKIFHSK